MMADLGSEPSAINKSSPDPQQIVEQEEQYTRLLKAIDALSPRNPSATLLFYQEQLSLKEVANRLNISVSAVKGRLHKARCQLREQLLPLQDQIQSSLQEHKTMTTKNVIQTEIKRCCSFCGKDSQQVDFLIAGSPPPFGDDLVYICGECVDICNKIIISAQRSNTNNN